MGTPSNSTKDTNYVKFLVMKCQQDGKNITKEDPFKVEEALITILGKRHKCKVEVEN